VPHGLIAAFGGDTVAAARLFADRYHGETNITVLVDFENDSVRTALDVAQALGERLWGVRLDTSEQLIDVALRDEPDPDSHRGVTALLARRVRDALDAAGHRHVRIVVSGGFDGEKIRAFEERGVPVDAYGVGSSLIRGANDFTADVVMTDGKPSGKFGRHLRDNPRLELVS
jgi:nicotinate phosphoribosyltransferase